MNNFFFLIEPIFFCSTIFFFFEQIFFIHQFFRFLVGMHHKNKGPIIRSHHGGYTASHPNCEVKHHWARSVLRWGTTRESRVSNVFFFVGETCRQIINMPAVILGIRCFKGPFFGPKPGHVEANRQYCGEFSVFPWFFEAQNPTHAERTSLPRRKRKKQTGKPRLNLTRSLQQGNSR